MCFSADLALAGTGMLSSVMGDFREVSNEILPKTSIANQNIQAAYDYARAFAFIVTSGGRADADATALAGAKTILADTVKLVNDNTAILEKKLSTDTEKALLAKVIEQHKAYGASRNRILELQKAGDHGKAVDLMFSETNRLQTVYIDAIKDLIHHEETLLQKGIDIAEKTYSNARTVLSALFIAVLVAGLAIAAFITRRILKSLGGEPEYAVAITGHIAAGNLATVVKLKPNDRHSLLFAINAMR